MSERRIAVLPGSYDPVTAGHADLILRSAELFDEVWAVVSVNGGKAGFFTADERLELLRLCCAALPVQNVHTALCRGLTADFLRDKQARYLVRGVRDCTDFDYENDLSRIMRRFDPRFETVLLPSRPEIACVSSTYVRELLKYGCPLGNAVPAAAAERMFQLYRAKK